MAAVSDAVSARFKADYLCCLRQTPAAYFRCGRSLSVGELIERSSPSGVF